MLAKTCAVEVYEMDERIERWLSRDPDPTTRAELIALAESGDTEEIARRFAARLAFGTAGLRGVVGAGPMRMNRLVVRETSAGLGGYLIDTLENAKKRGVVVGYDARPDSRAFAEDCASVLTGCGIRVYLADTCLATPACAFALRALGACCAVVVTASHNPPEYNGYKVYWENGAQIIPPHDSGIAAAIDEAARNQIPWCEAAEAETTGLLEHFGQPLIERYLAGVLRISHRGPRPGRDDVVVAYTPLHGVGAALTETVLKRSGFTVHTVAEQREPDGRFPTVRFPNPEEPGAMDAVIALARQQDADVAIANDPDADRLAGAIRVAKGDYRMLSGDQMGVLLGLDRLSADREPQTALLANTVVSSQLLRIAAEAKGAKTCETLTGFKWIVNAGLAEAERKGLRFIFGYEEALGYTIGSLVRDKDGISAALCFCRAFGRAEKEGHHGPRAPRGDLPTTRPLSDRPAQPRVDRKRRRRANAGGQAAQSAPNRDRWPQGRDLDRPRTVQTRLRRRPRQRTGGSAAKRGLGLSPGRKGR
jgi:phosphomannomutase